MADPTTTRRRWGWGGVLGAVTGLAPHLLHHIAVLAGAALLAGVTGTVLFALLGLAAMVPLLLRMRRRSGGPDRLRRDVRPLHLRDRSRGARRAGPPTRHRPAHPPPPLITGRVPALPGRARGDRPAPVPGTPGR
jgi:hypothetical protein